MNQDGAKKRSRRSHDIIGSLGRSGQRLLCEMFYADDVNVSIHSVHIMNVFAFSSGVLCSGLHLVLSLCGNKVIVQDVLQELKSGPFLGLLLPAHHHHIVKFFGATVRARHPVQSVQIPDDLRVCHS